MKFLISFIGAIFWPKITSSVKKYFITLRPRSTHVIKQGSRGLNRSRPQEKIRSRKSGRLMLRVPLEVKPLLFSTSCLIYQTNQYYPTSSTNHFSLKIHNSMKSTKNLIIEIWKMNLNHQIDIMSRNISYFVWWFSIKWIFEKYRLRI